MNQLDDYPHRAAGQHLSRTSARRFGRGLIDIGLQFTLVLRGLRRDLVRIINLLVTMTAEPMKQSYYYPYHHVQILPLTK